MNAIARWVWLLVVVSAGCGDDTKDGARDTVSDSAATSVADTAVGETTVADTAEPTTSADTTVDTTAEDTSIDTTVDTSAEDVADVGPLGSCIDEGHAVGERYAAGDRCNFCECLANGVAQCSKRTCRYDGGACTYDGSDYAYGERFAATDGCNECVCAASGLACTRRCDGLEEEGAILLESLDEPCGEDPTFTGRAVLSGLPYPDLTAPFTYTTVRELYPETAPPSTIRVTVAYEEGGFVACRIPSPDQPAIDMRVTVQFVTADGLFDEGFDTYLRRNNFGFVDAWYLGVGIGPDALDGAYVSHCLDPNGFGFAATYYADQTAEGYISKNCETDINLTVGTFSVTP